MDKSKEGLKEESTQNSQDRDDSLVISINNTGKIVQFNKKCEKVTGYSREEALNKELFDFLIPKNCFEDWGRLFNLARQDKAINDLKLPWLSRQGKEIMISWSSFPVDEIGGDTEDICLVGKSIISNDDSKDSELPYKKEEKDDKESILNFIRVGLNKKGDADKKSDVAEGKGVSIGVGNKRIVIKEADSGGSKDIVHKDSKKVTPKEEKISVKSKPVEPVKPLETVKTVEKSNEKKLDEFLKLKERNNEDIHKNTKELEKRKEKLEKENKKLEQNLISIKTRHSVIKKNKIPHKTADSFRKKTSFLLSFLGGKRKRKEFDHIIPEKKKDLIYKTIKEIERKNEKLEKENKKLKLNLKDLNIRVSDIEKDKIPHEARDSEPVKSKTSILVNSLSGKKKQAESGRLIIELEERKNFLDNLETQLTREKAEINEQRNEFRKWREKLEFLEEEIEKRRVELINQEKEFKDQIMTSPAEEIPFKPTTELTREMQDVNHEILDEIPESAAIVKRGIMKQVNRSFVELLGYDMNMLLEKSLLDFIAPEGISGIEEYYLRRLKGGIVSNYETVFLTKNDDKMVVRINIKPTTFNGEKAEIAVIKKLDKKEENKN